MWFPDRLFQSGIRLLSGSGHQKFVVIKGYDIEDEIFQCTIAGAQGALKTAGAFLKLEPDHCRSSCTVQPVGNLFGERFFVPGGDKGAAAQEESNLAAELEELTAVHPLPHEVFGKGFFLGPLVKG